MNLLKQLLSDQEKTFWTALRMQRAKEIEERKVSHKWDGKFHPSSLQWNMCPHSFVRELETFNYHDTVASEYMDDGTYKHKQIQDVLLRTNLLYPKPQNLTKKQEQKLKKHWPEVPIEDLELNISGKVDGVIKLDGNPVIIDIKTVQATDKNWEKRYPPEKHKTQLCCYALVMNRNKIYNVPIRKVGLMYINLCMSPRDKNREFEYYFDFTPELEEKTLKLLEELNVELIKYKKGIESNCEYSNCSKHNKTKIKEDTTAIA